MDVEIYIKNICERILWRRKYILRDCCSFMFSFDIF